MPCIEPKLEDVVKKFVLKRESAGEGAVKKNYFHLAFLENSYLWTGTD